MTVVKVRSLHKTQTDVRRLELFRHEHRDRFFCSRLARAHRLQWIVVLWFALVAQQNHPARTINFTNDYASLSDLPRSNVLATKRQHLHSSVNDDENRKRQVTDTSCRYVTTSPSRFCTKSKGEKKNLYFFLCLIAVLLFIFFLARHWVTLGFAKGSFVLLNLPMRVFPPP